MTITLAPRVETPRLVLRPHRAADLDAVAALWADPEVVRYIGGKPATRQDAWSRILRYAGHWALLGFGYWAIELRATGAFVGEIGLANFERDVVPPLDAPELGFALVPAVHRQGIAHEAAEAVLAREGARFPRTVALVDEGHRASARVLARLGYVESGRTSYGGAAVVRYERHA